MAKKQYQSKEKSVLYSVGIGSIISLITLLAGALIVTLLITNQSIDESAAGYGVMAVMFLSSMVGCFASVLMHRSKVMIVSICTSLTFVILLLAITAMFFFFFYNDIPITLLVITGSGISTALVIGHYLNRPPKFHKKVKL